MTDKLEILKKYPIMDWEWPRILVGIPLERSVSHASKVFWPFVAIARKCPAFLQMPYTRTDVYRNKAAVELLKTDFTHLLMLDLDHIHPQDIIERLAKRVIENPDIQVIGGLNFRRSEPYEPCAFIQDKEGMAYALANWAPGLIKVDVLGTGSILIAREVFEQLEPPWFFNPYVGVWENRWPGEDTGFCTKCREAGIDMWVDTTVTSPHINDYLVDETMYRAYQKEHGIRPMTDEEMGALGLDIIEKGGLK